MGAMDEMSVIGMGLAWLGFVLDDELTGIITQLTK